jgi:hypothetical protein
MQFSDWTKPLATPPLEHVQGVMASVQVRPPWSVPAQLHAQLSSATKPETTPPFEQKLSGQALFSSQASPM